VDDLDNSLERIRTLFTIDEITSSDLILYKGYYDNAVLMALKANPGMFLCNR
jgi:hypothetical protein